MRSATAPATRPGPPALASPHGAMCQAPRTHRRRPHPAASATRAQSPSQPSKPPPDFRPGVDADAIPECDLDDDELAALLGSKELDEDAMAVLRDKVWVFALSEA
jgi:hypothetical protein